MSSPDTHLIPLGAIVRTGARLVVVGAVAAATSGCSVISHPEGSSCGTGSDGRAKVWTWQEKYLGGNPPPVCASQGDYHPPADSSIPRENSQVSVVSPDGTIFSDLTPYLV